MMQLKMKSAGYKEKNWQSSRHLWNEEVEYLKAKLKINVIKTAKTGIFETCVGALTKFMKGY